MRLHGRGAERFRRLKPPSRSTNLGRMVQGDHTEGRLVHPRVRLRWEAGSLFQVLCSEDDDPVVVRVEGFARAGV